MVWSLLYGLTRNSLGVMLLRLRGDTAKDAKILVLRHQLGVLQLRRRVHVLRATRNPPGAWVTPQARNLLMDLDQSAQRFRFLVRDRDTKLTDAFEAVFATAGITVLRTPPQSPRANAFAERWVGSARRACTDRLLIFSRRHLEAVLRIYADHFNGHRPHRSLGQRPPTPPPEPTPISSNSAIRQTRLLGCVINEYRNAA
ncbi:integrase core domain-containing protein [Actinomadura nitritigenes]